MEQMALAFSTEGTPVGCDAFGNGHINRTFLITTDAGKRYILQRINRFVFRDPVGVVRNADAVTSFIRSKGHIALRFLKDRAGQLCPRDPDGEYWRMYEFVEGFCMDSPESAEDFYQSALAFGQFQELLADFPAHTLVETIPNFHNTPERFRQLKAAIAADKAGRLSSVREEVEFYLSQEEMGSRLQQMKEAGVLPLRVTHNDTKFNNVLLDSDSHLPLCVLDLDTVMPGLSLYDFGDAIRSGACTGAEDERDVSKIHLDIGLFEMYVKGYLKAAPSLTDREIDAFPLAAFTMTLECGSRFLADYLNGDEYFRVAYPEHNLVRCRTHIALVKDILQHYGTLQKIVADAKAILRG